MNEISLMGRLTADPKIGTTKGENPKKVAEFTLAVKSSLKDSDGEYHTDFIFCAAYGKRAEFIEKNLKKGNFIALHGSLNVRSWDNESGTKQFKTTVIADKLHFTYNTNEGKSESN